MAKLTPEKKNKLQALLKRVDSLEGSLPKGEIQSLTDRLINDEVKSLESKLRENPTIKYLDEINKKLVSFKREFRLGPVVKELNALISDVSALKGETENSIKEITSSVEERFNQLKSDIESGLKNVDSSSQKFTASSVAPLSKALRALQQELSSVSQTSSGETFSLRETLSDFDKKVKQLKKDLNSSVNSNNQLLVASREDVSKEIGQSVESLRRDIYNRLGQGGGNMNRRIQVNSSVMSSKYTDINFIGGAGIAWVATDDNTLKQVNIQPSIIVGTGGGSGSQDFLTIKEIDGNPTVGSVVTIRFSNGTVTDDGGGQVTVNVSGSIAGGINRTVSVLSVSSTLAADSNIDYAFFPNVGINLTLPTAVSNSNRYTIKNMSASSVLVTAAAGQNIDGANTALISSQYESIDLISNNSVWGVV